MYVLKKYDNKKRGRPSVSGFEFTFIKDNTKKKKESTYDRLKRERDERRQREKQLLNKKI